MYALEPAQRQILKHLNIPYEEVLIRSCLEGLMGLAWVDDLKSPTYGLVAVGDFLYLLGHVPQRLNPDWSSLVENHGRNQIIVTFEPEWAALLKQHFAERHVPFKRYAFHWDPTSFNKATLTDFVTTVAPEYELVPFNLELAEMALKNPFTADFCMFFESPQAFLEQGLGFAIVREGEIVAGASSYSACRGAIDITIGTVDAYRRKGLALKCAAALILECLERGIYPRWDAVNLESVALAEKLGYKLKGVYEVSTIR